VLGCFPPWDIRGNYIAQYRIKVFLSIALKDELFLQFADHKLEILIKRSKCSESLFR
jgi:hypothetical protein